MPSKSYCAHSQAWYGYVLDGTWDVGREVGCQEDDHAWSISAPVLESYAARAFSDWHNIVLGCQQPPALPTSVQHALCIQATSDYQQLVTTMAYPSIYTTMCSSSCCVLAHGTGKPPNCNQW